MNIILRLLKVLLVFILAPILVILMTLWTILMGLEQITARPIYYIATGKNYEDWWYKNYWSLCFMDYIGDKLSDKFKKFLYNKN